jgi:hypothetical protein
VREARVEAQNRRAFAEAVVEALAVPRKPALPRLAYLTLGRFGRVESVAKVAEFGVFAVDGAVF